MKRLGPELKMPKLKGGEMKVPPFVSDLYFDLRERRLLPLVILVLVAIVATPFLLAGGSKEPEAASPPPIAGGTASPAAKTLDVVKAEPGLRNYKKRLGRRSPTNPFKQRFDGPHLTGAQLNEPTAATTSTTSTTTTTESRSTPETTLKSSPSSQPSGSTHGGGGGNEELPQGLTLFTFAIDVQITRIEPKPDGSVVKTGPTLHKEVIPPAALPGEKAPLATYLGMGASTEQPMFLVSPEVTALYGKGQCLSGGASLCQLLSLAEGSAETFEYGPNHVRYKIEIVKVTPVVTGKS